ncbi:Hemolysin, chromosomal [Anatilimnocola aggregata]|uniref:Hemolysin, chromosomal n=1 Tax=Anatilimnocola aggregata TaxID=2528021 RepID=A0A517YE99_9BACT|nr:GEVED domain-containing protein [Anatilimnocola aggregata]QDU28544.1 Hemolysin, chromosomal [Anatilimnocola aggregata]
MFWFIFCFKNYIGGIVMHQSVKRWFQSLKHALLSDKGPSAERAKNGIRRAARKSLRLEALEERSMFAVAVVDNGSELVISTNANDNVKISAAAGILSVSSTTGLVNGNAQSGGVSTATFNLADFTTINVFSENASPLRFENVEIAGSAEFANESIVAIANHIDLTTGPLSVSGLSLATAVLGAAITVDHAINSTGNVSLIPLGASVSVQAPINAAGSNVTLIAGTLVPSNFTVTQTSAGAITAASVRADGAGGVDLSPAANVVGTIAGGVSGAGNFKFNNDANLTVGLVNVNGIQVTNGDVSLSVTATHSITTDRPIGANGTNKTITLAADSIDLDEGQSLGAANVVLQTVGAGANLTLGNAGLTNNELNAINATNLTVQAAGTITVSGAIDLVDNVSHLITLRAPAVNVANSISGNSSTGTLRFETNSLSLNGAIPHSVSAPAVEISTTANVAFNSTFNAGGMDFMPAELAALDEGIVDTLRIITTGDISFTGLTTDFADGFTLTSSAAVALQAGGTISTSSGGAIIASQLAAKGNSVALTSTSNMIASLAGSASGGNFEVTNSGAMTINTVDVGGRGIGATGINVTGAGNGIAVTAGGTLTVSQVVKAPGDITLTTTGSTSDLVTQHNSNYGINSSGGTTTLDSGRDIFLGTALGTGDVIGEGLVLNAVNDIFLDTTTYAEADGAAGVTVTAGGDVQIIRSIAFASRLNSNAAGAPISITTGAGKTFVVDSGSSGGVAANGGNITIETDNAELTSWAIATSGTVTWQTVTNGRGITLGSEVAGSLSLTDAELDLVEAGTLVVGSATTGAITVTADITRTASTAVELISASNIVQNGAAGSINTGGGTLLLTPGSTAEYQPNRSGADITASTASFTSGSDLDIVLNGTTVDTQYTQLNVAGTVNLTGVDLALSGSHTPVLGNVFTVVSATSRSGTFNGLANNDEITLNGETLRINYTATSVTLTAIGDPPVVDAVGPFSIPEYSAIATAVGTVTATDPDANPTFTWSITAGNTGGTFAINNAGEITVADSSLLVFTTNPTFTLTVQVSDGIYTDTGSVTINLTNVADYDYGDAPVTYGVAQHYEGDTGTGPLLGTRDYESASQPNATATGDDATGTDDEDGVTFSSTTLQPRINANVTLNASAAGIVDAWIDFNRNGMFDAAEKIASGLSVTTGANTFAVTVPDNAVTGTTYARFRISTAGSTLPTGLANDGEVEDYQLTIQNFAAGTAVLVDDPENPGPTNPDVLVITGRDNISDAIVVRTTSPGMVTVYMAPGGSLGTFPLASISRMIISGRSGNDSIVVESTAAKPINVPTTIYGDAGNDSISGGSGPDTIIGGDGVDSMAGNAGNDIFIGGNGNDVIAGGAGFDRIIEQPGAASVLATQLIVGTSTDRYSQIEQIELTGTAAGNSFVINNSTANVLIDGAGGNDTLSYTGDGNFVLTNSLLTRTSGATTATVTVTDITSVSLIGGAAANKFTVSEWTRTLAVNGGGGTDTIDDFGSDNYVLTPSQLQRSGRTAVSLVSVENAVLTSTTGTVDGTFTFDNWAGSATVNAGAGVDTLVVIDNAATMTLTNAKLTRTGRGAITFYGIEAAELTGGASANNINASAFSGKLQIDGKGGNDTLTSGSGVAIVFGGEGNDTLVAGSGPAVLVGGNGNDTLRVAGTPPGGSTAGHAILIGGAGIDKLTGGAGEDLLIDSSTDFDLIAADLANLLAHWTGVGSYQTRSAQLASDLNGQLNPDGVSDTLSGGIGALDLFFANLTGSATVKDKLLDLNRPSTEITINNV